MVIMYRLKKQVEYFVRPQIWNDIRFKKTYLTSLIQNQKLNLYSIVKTLNEVSFMILLFNVCRFQPDGKER